MDKGSIGEAQQRFRILAFGLGVSIEAELVCPRPIDSFEIIRNGEPIELSVEKTVKEGIRRWKIGGKISVTGSCWIAARAFGVRKERLFAEGQQLQKTMMHSAAIPVIVDGRPVRVEKDIEAALAELRNFRERYRVEGKFPDDAARDAMLKLFDRAIAKLHK